MKICCFSWKTLLPPFTGAHQYNTKKKNTFFHVSFLFRSIFLVCLFIHSPINIIALHSLSLSACTISFKSLISSHSPTPTLTAHFSPSNCLVEILCSLRLSLFVFFVLRLPQKNSNVSFHTKVNVRFDLVCHVRTKTSPHNAVPVRSVLLIKVCSYLSSCFFVRSAGDTVTGR